MHENQPRGLARHLVSRHVANHGSRAWSYLASKHYLVQCSAQRSPDENTLRERTQKLGKAFDRREKKLGKTPYFSGQKLGMVDIAWLPLLHRAAIIHRRTGCDFLGSRPKLKKWQGELIGTGLPEKSVAPDFEEAFSRFYLSEQTFLGRGEKVENSCFGEACATDACC